MGDAEGLMQIEMAHISPDDAWRCQPHLQVSPVLQFRPIWMHFACQIV